MRKIIFGIRKSRLALKQLDEFLKHLASKDLNFNYSIKTIMTKADNDQVSPVHEMGQGFLPKRLNRRCCVRI